MSVKGTTNLGFVNRSGNVVIRLIERPGGFGQFIYVLRCVNGHEFGTVGTDIWARKCEICQGGRPGLTY